MVLSLKKQLAFMAAIAVIAVLFLLFMTKRITEETSIGSQNYQQIIYANELTADILPPPMFLLESMMKIESLPVLDAAERLKVMQEIKQHFKDHDDRIARWKSSSDIPSDIKDYILTDLHKSSKKLMDAMNDDIYPAVESGNQAEIIAAIKTARDQFSLHQKAVDSLVKMAVDYANKNNSQGIETVAHYKNLLLIVGILAAVVVILTSIFFSRSILKNLGADPKELKRITDEVVAGNLNVKINAKQDSSVLSSVASMVSSLRDSIGAISRSQAVIEFSMDGMVLTANENFLSAFGYKLEEIKGKHHSLFATPEIVSSQDYKQFWQMLNRGEYQSARYTRVKKNGDLIWIQASYNPVFDLTGKPYKVIKFATDISEQASKEAEFSGQIAAIHKSQAVIEFNLDGTVLFANQNFLDVLGYSLDEVRGKHHRMFVEKDYAQSPDYRQFWEKLSNGNYDAGQYKRIAKSGREVWIQASYNPILNAAGKPFKVIKYATDITDRVNESAAMSETVQEVRAIVSSAVKGDLTNRISTQNKTDRMLELSTGVNSLLDNMEDVIHQIRTSAETIFTASNEIAQGNADLSSRTEQQAANLEETASSMEELTSTVKLNADNAKQANVLAEQASSVATDGGALIQKVVVTMDDINQSAKKISDIIGVIDGIAFQTNILALNAAVEAARAGDQGRGFAVVASEVRTLAQRSANAAKDIKALISDSVQKIESGNSLVNKSGETMKEIVNSIKRVNDIMSEIAAASNEQSTGIEEVSTAVSQMDEMTQQNAALVEEAAAAAESLQSQADQLNRSVGQFRLSIESNVTSAPRLATPRASQSRESTPSAPKKLTPPKSNADDEWESF